jgi:hypothetical protein
MKTTNLNIEANELQINNAVAEFCPFGSLDIRTAVNVALRAGKGTNYVYECVNEFAVQCAQSIDNCDPVYCVMDAILQEARSEICEQTNFDFCNDLISGSIDTYGNFMCSSFKCSDDAKEQLIEVLKNNNIDIDDLSEATQYFLDAIEITQDDVNAISGD